MLKRSPPDGTGDCSITVAVCDVIEGSGGKLSVPALALACYVGTRPDINYGLSLLYSSGIELE